MRHLGGPRAPGAARRARALAIKTAARQNDLAGPTAEQSSRSGRVARAKRGNNKLQKNRELFAGALLEQDGLLLHAAGVPAQTWFGRIPSQDKRRPLAQNDLTPRMMTSGGACLHPGCLRLGAAKRKPSA